LKDFYHRLLAGLKLKEESARELRTSLNIFLQSHKHDYIPVDVLWLDVWSALSSGKNPKPFMVVTACECGAVKLIPAKLKDKKKVVEYYKNRKKGE